MKIPREDLPPATLAAIVDSVWTTVSAAGPPTKRGASFDPPTGAVSQLLDDPPVSPSGSSSAEEEQEQVAVLGSYRAMASEGVITLRGREHGRVAAAVLWEGVRDERLSHEHWTRENIRWLVESSLQLTYCHELFHHACDVLQCIAAFQRSADPEEPMAVAFAFSCFGSGPEFPDELRRGDRTRLKRELLRWRGERYAPPYDKFERYQSAEGLAPQPLADYLGWNPTIRRGLIGELLPKLVKRLGKLHAEIQIK